MSCNKLSCNPSLSCLLFLFDIPAWRLMKLYSILVDFSPTFYCLPKPLFLYGSMALLSYMATTMYIYVHGRHSAVCVCFLPIYSGRQVRWMYQPGSHRRKVTQDFSSTFLRCMPLFSREKDSAVLFPRRP